MRSAAGPSGLLGRAGLRERLAVGLCLVALGALAWVYTADMAIRMPDMPAYAAVAAGRASPWLLRDLALALGMWTVMMAGMMLPGALPTILLVTAVKRREAVGVRGGLAFAAGYLLVWTGFSLAATLLQAALLQWGWLTPMLTLAGRWMGAALFAAAGLYELSALKRRCLGHCRSTLQVLAHGWRPGVGGALRMGLAHGLYCVGCCTGLMALLFVGGVMDLRWVVGLAVLVMLQKLLPGRAATLSVVTAAGCFAAAIIIAAGVVG